MTSDMIINGYTQVPLFDFSWGEVAVTQANYNTEMQDLIVSAFFSEF